MFAQSVLSRCKTKPDMSILNREKFNLRLRLGHTMLDKLTPL